jgi:transcriptional regulator GlxA family with amidase domain
MIGLLIVDAYLAQKRIGINANKLYFCAMTHRIAFLVFPGFQLLDAVGPAAVFDAASEAVPGGYSVKLVSQKGGLIAGSSGMAVDSTALAKAPPSKFDSFFIVGANAAPLEAAAALSDLRDWARDAAILHSRYGSICSGSALLAAWDIVGPRRFATHWSAASEIRKRWPDLNLDAEAIFVEDGALWTSAGVTTGIDMALAIVERDHGAALAQSIAQRLVLASRRPGWQSQFSPLLSAQGTGLGSGGRRYSDLVAWLDQRFAEPIRVEDMAARVGESLRSFQRNFTATLGQSPAQFLTRHRVDRARALISEGVALKQVATITGFADVARLSSAFKKTCGLTAHEWRVLHGAVTLQPTPAHLRTS